MTQALTNPGTLGQFVKGTSIKLRRQLGADVVYPYMKVREVDILQDILLNLKPARCLEYGSGYSTLYLTQYLPEGSSWVSLEHESGWYELIKKRLDTDPRVAYYNVPPNATEWSGDGSYAQFQDYVDYPKTLGGTFDFILVDGRARTDCAAQVREMLNPGGILIMHDVNRAKYHASLAAFPHHLILEDHRKNAGGFGFAANEPIESFFDVARHAAVWKRAAVISNIFKFKYLLGKTSKPYRLHTHQPA